MPADLSEGVADCGNVEGMIDKCVVKLKNILDRWRSYFLEDDLKEFKDILEYQGIIKRRVKLLLDNQELERIDQKDLSSPPWQFLGNGQYGEVFKAKLKGASVAVKILETIQDSSKINEGDILRLLRHDNIVAYRGLTKEKTSGKVMIIMEYVPDNLEMYVENLKSPEAQGLPKSRVWDFGEQIMSGLYYLHSFSIAHRDLKPDNILLEKGLMRLKLADFGLALHLKNQNNAGENYQHFRWCAPECLPDDNDPEIMNEVDFFTKSDIFSYGLVLYYMITGIKPWAEEKSQAAGLVREKNSVPDTPKNLGEGPLSDLYHSCLRWKPSERPTAAKIVNKKFQAHTTNPYTITTQTAEFFTCGFLKDTQIIVADSLVHESFVGSNGRPEAEGYPRKCLYCEVEINEEYDDCDDAKFGELYRQRHDYWHGAAMDKKIDNHLNIALKSLTLSREGEEEEQRVILKFAPVKYVHHRAMQDVWKKQDESTKAKLLPCKTSVHPMFSTSFGLHVAVITADEPPLFVFTRRANTDGVASPGNFTCGAVESCSAKKDCETNFVDLRKTAARGLNEELGVVLKGKDLEAICLTTVYLKYDKHEWGMCGFVDLSDERISSERRLTYDSIKSRFTGGTCKDKFEHDRLVPVPFQLSDMAHFVRDNFHEFASSTKLVVVKVMQSFFGVAEVEKIFKALDTSS